MNVDFAKTAERLREYADDKGTPYPNTTAAAIHAANFMDVANKKSGWDAGDEFIRQGLAFARIHGLVVEA